MGNAEGRILHYHLILLSLDHAVRTCTHTHTQMLFGLSFLCDHHFNFSSTISKWYLYSIISHYYARLYQADYVQMCQEEPKMQQQSHILLKLLYKFMFEHLPFSKSFHTVLRQSSFILRHALTMSSYSSCFGSQRILQDLCRTFSYKTLVLSISPESFYISILASIHRYSF